LVCVTNSNRRSFATITTIILAHTLGQYTHFRPQTSFCSPKFTSPTYNNWLHKKRNNTFTLPPTDVTFPAQVVKNPVHNHWWNFRLHERCNKEYLHHRIFPYGNLEVELLNIRPPTRKQELCQQLSDPDHLFKSYLRLQNFIQKSTAKNYTWFSWPIKYSNTTQLALIFNKSLANFPMIRWKANIKRSIPHSHTIFKNCRKHGWTKRSPPLKLTY